MSELTDVRRTSIQANNRGDFRAVARLTLEAAVINRSIMDVDVAEMIAA